MNPLALLVGALLLGVCLAGPTPVLKSYCGSFDWAQIHIVILNNETLYAFGEVTGALFSCSHVAYHINAQGTMTLPDMYRQHTCLGDLMSYYEINPHNIFIDYNSDNDTIDVTDRDYSFSLQHCDVDLSKDPVADVVVLEQVIVREAMIGETFVRETIVSTTEIVGSFTDLLDVADPNGLYCGTVAGAANINASVVDSSHINVSASVFGANYDCNKEQYFWNKTDNSITFPTITQPSDCIGQIIADFGQDPGTLLANYDPKSDTVTIQIAGQVIILGKKCPPAPIEFSKEKWLALQSHLASSAPSYYGSVPPNFDVVVSVTDTTHWQINSMIYQTSVGCENESVAINGNTVSFPNIKNPDDCLNNQLQPYGLDPQYLSVTYDKDADVYTVSYVDEKTNVVFPLKRTNSNPNVFDYNALL